MSKRLYMWGGLLFVLVTMNFRGFTQTDAQDALQALRELTSKYYSAAQLKFDITYRYAEENKPAIYLDSLKGNFRMSGNKYWFMIDSTVTISNIDTTVMIFKEDQVMYLSKPSKELARKNPIAMLDTFFFNNPDFSIGVQETLQQKIITISASNASPGFKKIEYVINKQSGYLERINSLIDATLLYDDGVQRTAEKSSTYAFVEMVFSNYDSLHVDPSIFDLSSYFIREGHQYTPVQEYQNYKIFLGSPNL